MYFIVDFIHLLDQSGFDMFDLLDLHFNFEILGKQDRMLTQS